MPSGSFVPCGGGSGARFSGVEPGFPRAHRDGGEGLSADEIVDIVVHQELVDLAADGPVIVMVDGDVLRPVAALGTSSAALSRLGVLTMNRSVPLVAAVRDGAPVYVPSRREASARFPELAGAAGDSEAWAALPLIANGSPVGAMGVSFQREHGFSEMERRFLGTLANLTALALAPHTSGLVSATTASDGYDATEMVVLDGSGVIMETNSAWLRFCDANGGDPARCGIGMWFLDV